MIDRSEAVLVWAPRGRDAEIAVRLIERHGLRAAKVTHGDELVASVLEAGCAIIAAEALTEPTRAQLAAALADQPPWSDFPIILFAPSGAGRADEALAAVRTLGNVSILERPVHSGALISAVVAALRGRRRQYEARDAIHRRDQFLAMLGHELRNPLAAVMLALETVPAEGTPIARQHAIIERQTRHLARLVDDLLDVARVTSGKVHLQLATLDLNEVASRCVHAAELAARARRTALRTDLWPQPLLVDGDPVRLDEVLNNLIENALKYSPPGSAVTVRTRRDGPQCVVEVVDNGIGIAPEMLGRVFELFTQAEGTLDRSSGGLGIGLTLVRSLVQLHRGTVAAHSEGLGRGSTFVLTLPPAAGGAPVPTPPPALSKPPLPQQRRVLLVEDNEDVLEMTRAFLENSDCAVTTAIDGAAGLAALVEHRYDVAFIDIGISRMDGYAVAEQARARGVTTYLVAVTGYGQPEDRQRAHDAGFDQHLTKPVTGAALLDALGAAIGGGARATNRHRQGERPPR